MKFDRERLDDLLRGPRPVRRGLVLLTVAVTLVALTAVASLWRWGYVVPQELFHHPLRHPLIASVLLIWAIHLLIRNVYVHALAIMGAITLACLWYVGFRLVATGIDAPETLRPTADARYEARVEQVPLMFEPRWRVLIRERAGMFSREWELACLHSRYEQLRWVRPGLLDLGDGTRVRVDPETGKPIPGQDRSSTCS